MYFFLFTCLQTKPLVGSLKRKSESDAPNEMSEASDSAPMKDAAPPLSPAPTKDSGNTSSPSINLNFSQLYIIHLWLQLTIIFVTDQSVHYSDD